MLELENKMKIILILTFGILFGSSTAFTECSHIYLQGKVKNILIPILKERILEYKMNYDSTGEYIPIDYDSKDTNLINSRRNMKLDSLFGNTLETRNKYTNEIMAILLGIYFGEHPLEEIECEIVNRGSKMIPYLLKYKDKCISKVNEITIPDNIILKEDIQRHYDECIKEIKEKQKCEQENED